MQKPKFAANLWNTLTISTQFPASVSVDSVLTVSRAMWNWFPVPTCFTSHSKVKYHKCLEPTHCWSELSPVRLTTRQQYDTALKQSALIVYLHPGELCMWNTWGSHSCSSRGLWSCEYLGLKAAFSVNDHKKTNEKRNKNVVLINALIILTSLSFSLWDRLC